MTKVTVYQKKKPEITIKKRETAVVVEREETSITVKDNLNIEVTNATWQAKEW